MNLNEVTSGERVHIAFFGMRNAGKSSLVNAVTAQGMSVVSEIAGTTTDPVRKSMELLPLGPVVIIDTPGLDDEGALGEKRVERAKTVLDKTDIAVLVVDATKGMSELDRELLDTFAARKIPHLVAYNKSDLLSEEPATGENEIYVSALSLEHINELKERIAGLRKDALSQKVIVSDLLKEGDLVVLVIPIDEAAPKGRLILPQQQTIRDILDAHCSVVCCQDDELADTLCGLSKKPRMVITDSQVFEKVAAIVPEDMWLTSFSVLMARYKGQFEDLIAGAEALSKLKEGDKVLIAESCTHHRQCNDIGTVKLPNWIRKYTTDKVEFGFCSGGEYPAELSEYRLIVHCGGCMLNETAMHSRIAAARQAGVPIVNYGIAIAQMHGILERSLAPFDNFRGVDHKM